MRRHPLYKAVYLLILIHFLREISRRILVPARVPPDFLVFKPGDNLCIDILVTYNTSMIRIFRGIATVSSEISREAASAMIESMNGLGVDGLFRKDPDVCGFECVLSKGRPNEYDVQKFMKEFGPIPCVIIGNMIHTVEVGERISRGIYRN